MPSNKIDNSAYGTKKPLIMSQQLEKEKINFIHQKKSFF